MIMMGIPGTKTLFLIDVHKAGGERLTRSRESREYQAGACIMSRGVA